jgi:hypothetical protein
MDPLRFLTSTDSTETMVMEAIAEVIMDARRDAAKG